MKRSIYLLVLLFNLDLSAQSLQSVSKKESNDDIERDWHNLDFKQDKIYGTSTNRAFSEIIKDRAPKKKIVVAVLDSGVEVDHDDLKKNIWINQGEILDNGVDDDQNGFVDDVHGWNFLVMEDGSDLDFDNLEATRILRASREMKEFSETYDWLTNEMIGMAVEIYNDQVSELKSSQQLAAFYQKADSMLQEATGKTDWTYEEVIELEQEVDPLKSMVKVIKIFNKLGVTKSDFKEINEQVSKMENYYLNYDYAPVKARSADVSNYGNNHYEGPDASHGTHVAGLIAAERSNNIGARGIASNCVEIMSVRTVPDGDERDLDIANAIHYAVDNGANIINMSFGKELSPHKAEVDAAIRYAAEKNVLIVHAAGNDSENNDEVNNFPNPIYLQGGRAENYLTVGASSISKKKDLIAEFSNYGKEEVDLFAPGKEVYSTMPDNAYKMQSGTSMASPVAVGVAALVWAYHPELTAIELKQLLMDSCTNLSRKKVKMPGDKSKIRFGELSQTGGIINAYNALMMADSKTTN